ncbi:hypothetical protein [Pseudomonas syringae]|uniref:hypothetical protein n=1 Tax=Pseudomonas syringae TaxID=317 RepID=UPI0015C4E4EC|nr:hypothetical protein [Pseudomonas syringae]
MRPIIVVNDPNTDSGTRGLHRHEGASHPDVKPSDNRSLFRNRYDQLSNPESDT